MTNSTTNLHQAWEQSWPAPAKINRFLHIVGKKPDGYHLLQSVFQIVDFCDYLKFNKVSNSTITLSESLDNIKDQDNLVIKAAELLQKFCQIESGVCISINKNLPMGAGLGGGSSNAATTLLVLNLLWDCQLTIPELTRLGLQLGADVPFFIQGTNAFVEGIGEKITPLSIDCPWLLLALPETQIATKEIFSESKLTCDTAIISIEMLNQLDSNDQHQLLLNGYGKNDCEKVVLSKYPQVKQLFEQLKAFSNPRLTGTGSCIFSLFESYTEANQDIPNNPNPNKFLVKQTLPESPILPILKKFNNIPADNNKKF